MRLRAWITWSSTTSTNMSNRSQSVSVLQAGNPPASPGLPHSEVVVNVFREATPRTGVSSTPTSATSLPASPASSSAHPSHPSAPAVAIPSAVPPVGGSVPLSPPAIPSSLDRESVESASAVNLKLPISFEPFGSEVLKSLHEFGLGGSTGHEPALPAPFEVPAAPDYYFLPKL